jgi:predicted RNA-binding protein (virulence factor B family)
MAYSIGDRVEIQIGRQTAIGFTVLIEQDVEGMIYKNELYRKVYEGDKLTAYIKKIREDGKIDVSLQPIGFRNTSEKDTDAILNALRMNDGRLELNDKSAPDEIKYELEMSKKAFKRAIGVLYKRKLITIDQKGISLTNKGQKG